MPITPARLRCGFPRQVCDLEGYEMQANAKKKAVLDRIKSLEGAISKGREFRYWAVSVLLAGDQFGKTVLG